MPKKHPGMTPEDQSQSFRDAVQKMTDDGALNPIEADAAFERALHGSRLRKPPEPK